MTNWPYQSPDHVFCWFSFFGVDATLQVGVKKVFNFLGQLTEENLANLAKEKAARAANKKVGLLAKYE